MSIELLLILVGVLAPFVIQGVKLIHTKLTGGNLSPASSMGWTYAVCLALAIIAKVSTGELIIPTGTLDVVLTSIFTQLGIVLGMATAVYKLFISGDTALPFMGRR